MVFPDATLPTNLNGGFATQDEFREYVMTRHQSGRWDSFIHARPSAVRVADYTGEALAKAFPLVFPFGHSGCAEDPAIVKLIALRKQKRFFFSVEGKGIAKVFTPPQTYMSWCFIQSDSWKHSHEEQGIQFSATASQLPPH